MKITVTSVSSQKKAKELAKALIEKKLAVCAHYFQIDSVYFWEQKLHEQKEWVLHIKSKDSSAVEKFLEKNHEYSCPMIYSFCTDYINEKYKKYLEG